MHFTLQARPPFSLPAVVRSHGWVQLDPFTRDEQTGGFCYVFQLGAGGASDGPDGAVIDVRLEPAAEGVGVTVDRPLSRSEQDELSGTLTWMLGLDQDFSRFYVRAASEPRLAHAASRAQGRILRSPSLFEDVVKTLLTTNTLWAATIRMNRNLVRQFGASLPADPSRQAFPTPERLAATDEETLRRDTRLGYRAPYVLELARRVAGGDLDLEALKQADLPTLELRSRLLAIKGVGAYAAANLLMLLGRYDFIPVDSWALKMVSTHMHNGAPVTKADVEAAFERWGEWKGLAYWMWDWGPE